MALINFTTIRALTPPEVAFRLGVSADKITGWIKAGEITAINVATTSKGRPRWAIEPAALLDFQRRRSSTPPAPASPPSRRRRGVLKPTKTYF